MATSSNKTILIIVLGLLVIAGVVFAITKDKEVSGEQNVPEQGKLDINAVCTSALAYMTFPDGAAAELFIQECVEGKHPEVIERYKADMGITDDRAI